MEVSTEISQKIRSAIKAKLMELGAYVDDELPDYIMVMVANKRSRAQMNKDLGLFLGSHTSSFTEWLHSLLAKLQTIRSDFDNKSADKQAKGGKVKIKEKLKGDKQIDGLDSVAKQEENLHSAEGSAENKNSQSNSSEGNKYKHSGDSREAGGSSSKLSIKSENNDIRADLCTNTTPMDAISEELMDSEVVPVTVGADTNSVSASLSPDRGQSYSVNRKRKAPSSLADGGKESPSEVFHSYDNPAFDGTSSELTTDNSPSLQVRRNTDDGASGDATNAHGTELPDHDDQPPQKVIKLAESVQLEDIKRALAEVLESTIRDDDIAHFSRMLESSLRKLRPPVVSLAKMRIQQILCEFETAAVQEENLVGNEPNANREGQAICLSNDLKFNSFGKHSRSLVAISGSGSVRNLLEGRHISSPSPQDESSLLQKKEGNENSDHLVDNAGIFQPKINLGNLHDHISVTCEYSSSDIRVNSEPHDSHVGKVVFHSKRTNSLKSIETTEPSSKAFDTVGRPGDRESTLAKLHDQSPQSPISLGKADISSPSSVHSCPLTSTLSRRVKRNVSSASRESTVSPDDLQSQPGSSHITRTKLTSTKNKILPSILVDSIHSRKRPESSESASVLRQSWHKDISPRPVDSSKPDVQDSPKQYGPEALKVMAKNLRITVINKRAVKSPQVSSSDDSDDEDDDTSDNDDEEENEDVKVNKSSIAKMKTSTATQKKVISDHSLP